MQVGELASLRIVGIHVGAHLQQARRLGCSTFLFLNPDAVVTPDVVEALRAATLADRAALVAPVVVDPAGAVRYRLLDSVRAFSRDRLREIYETSIAEIGGAVSPDLREELDRLALPFGEGTPTDAELRIAQAQLVGWLEGLFHGIQTALVAQQMAAQQQLQQMRALPPGPGASYGTPPGMHPDADGQGGHAGGPTGQYL